MLSKPIILLDKIINYVLMNNVQKIICVSLILLLIFSFPINQYDLMSDNSLKSANAESLPIKVGKDRNSEIWLLPDGNIVAKIGGEADINFFDNSTNSWKSSKSTALDGDSFKIQSGLISTVFDNDIIHYDMNMTGQVSRETPMLFHKIDNSYFPVVLTLQSRTVSISSESLFEIVGGITVNDPIEIITVNERYFTEFGDFLINYTYKDGKPLKHTFNLVPSQANSIETFSFTHDFELLNYNNEEIKSEKIDVINAVTKENIEPLITDKEIVDGKYDEITFTKSIDLKTIRLVESGTNELISELISDELLVLAKTDILTVNVSSDDYAKVGIVDGNNNFILGEIIAETSSAYSWIKFKEVILDNTQQNPHVKFVYGDWIGGFELDPDTYSSNNPIIDGYTIDNNDDVCNSGSVGKTTISTQLLSEINPSSGTEDCYFSFLDFDITLIPSTATVIDVDFLFDTQSVSNPQNCDYVSMGIVRGSDTGTNIWNTINSGIVMLDNDSTCVTAGNSKSVDFGSIGNSEVQTRVSASSGFFTFGIKPNDITVDTLDHAVNIASEEDGTATPKPTLEITYSTESPPSAPLNPIVYINSTSQVYFDWDAPTDCLNCGGYTVWNSTDNSIINNSTDSNTFYQLSGLTSGKNQTMFVSAWNGTGTGTNSTTVFNFTINTAPVLDKVNIINATAFQFFYTINGTFNGIQIDKDDFPYASFATFLSNSTSSAVSLIVNGFTEAVDTAMKIYAHNMGGTSAESNQIINATAITSSPILSVVQGSGLNLNLSWSAPVTGTATSYTIQRSPAGCASMASIATGQTGTSYVDSTTQSLTTYCYQVLSLNTFGSATSNQDSDTTGASQGGGSSGGGGSSVQQQSIVSDILNVDFIDSIHRAVLSQLVSGKIDVSWDTSTNMKVKSVIIDDSPFIVSFQQTPFTLIGDPSGISDGQINYSVKIPSKFCEDNISVGCVEKIRYDIPVTITADIDGTNITKNTVVVIDMTGKVDTPFYFVLLAIVAVPLAYVARKLGSRKHKRKIESHNGKSRKNGSASKSLSL